MTTSTCLMLSKLNAINTTITQSRISSNALSGHEDLTSVSPSLCPENVLNLFNSLLLSNDLMPQVK